MKDEFLIATNGYESTWPSIEYGAWAASCLGTPVALLGIAEHLSGAQIDERYPLEDIFGRAVELFKQKGLEYSLEIENGDAEEVIPRVAKEKRCITAFGPLGRPPLRRFLMGRSIRHLMAEMPTPILYVPHVCLPMRRLLICIGGLGYEVTAENLAIRLAVANQTEVTLLHVVPPIDLEYSMAREIRAHWQDLVHTDTLPGRNLRKALDAVRAAGLKGAIKARQGNVVEEILSEIKDGNYDLVCMGSPYSTHALRTLYTPNVTDEVAESVTCPVLTARYRRE